MPLQWTPNLATGNIMIDNQHKELFNRFGALIDAMSVGKGKDEVRPLISFLGDYIHAHFSSEESVMKQRNYPGLSEQQAQHAEFIKMYQSLKDELETTGITPSLTLRVTHELKDWLVNHISITDKKLGEYLKSH
jgi:hemerythrin